MSFPKLIGDELKKLGLDVSEKSDADVRGSISSIKKNGTITDYEMVALVSIDGLSRFAFSDKESDRTSGGDIVPARSTHTIKGYFRDVKTVEAFKVGSYSDSVGAKLLPAPDSGTVAVVFRAAWKVGETEPPGENNLATKLPPGTQVPSGGTDPTVPARRNIGNIRAVLRVRY